MVVCYVLPWCAVKRRLKNWVGVLDYFRDFVLFKYLWRPRVAVENIGGGEDWCFAT